MQETHVFAAVFLGACASGSLFWLAGILLTALLTFSERGLGRLVSKLLRSRCLHDCFAHDHSRSLSRSLTFPVFTPRV